jgi:hypothetical protein
MLRSAGDEIDGLGLEDVLGHPEADVVVEGLRYLSDHAGAVDDDLARMVFARVVSGEHSEVSSSKIFGAFVSQ